MLVCVRLAVTWLWRWLPHRLSKRQSLKVCYSWVQTIFLLTNHCTWKLKCNPDITTFLIILRPYPCSGSFDVTIPRYKSIILLLPWHIVIWNENSSFNWLHSLRTGSMYAHVTNSCHHISTNSKAPPHSRINLQHPSIFLFTLTKG